MTPIIRPGELGKELVKALVAVNKQIEEVHRQANRMGTEPQILRDERGNYLMTPLLAAQAQLLHSVTLINER